MPRPGSGWCTVYFEEVLDDLREQLSRQSTIGRVPEGMISFDEVRRRFGLSIMNWKRLERMKLVPRGRTVRLPGVGRSVRAYALDELKPMCEVFERAGPPYVQRSKPERVFVPVVTFRKSQREACVDAEDLPVVRGSRWIWCEPVKNEPCTILRANVDAATPLAHAVLGLAREKWHVFHLNGHEIDCRKENLKPLPKTNSTPVMRSTPVNEVGRPARLAA